MHRSLYSFSVRSFVVYSSVSFEPTKSPSGGHDIVFKPTVRFGSFQLLRHDSYRGSERFRAARNPWRLVQARVWCDCFLTFVFCKRVHVDIAVLPEAACSG